MYSTSLLRSAAILILFSLAGCYPVTEVAMVSDLHRGQLYTTDIPSKAVLHDGTILIYPHGCALVGDSLMGLGRAYGATEPDTAFLLRKAPIDDVAAVTYYRHGVPGNRVAASVLLGLTGATMLPRSIECLTNPKRCFGSCPTVYTYDESSSVLEAELFSSSVSPLYEASDLDRIGSDRARNGLLNMRITNEALETHFINTFDVVAVTHPNGTMCYPSANNSFCVTGEQVPASRAVSKAGLDISANLESADDDYYRTGDTEFKELVSMNEFDWIDVSVRVPEGATTAALVLRMKNSLLSTVLFYDMVLGSQGFDAVDWTARISTDPEYAAAFRSVYEMFSGISVKVNRGGAWETAAVYNDVGPISWKESALEISVQPGEELFLRLQFFPDNFLIDAIAFSFRGSKPYDTHEQVLPALSVVGNDGQPSPEVLQLMAKDDSQYLETNPGDAYRLVYALPEPEDMETTLFVRSKGYYTEWIRGNWVRQEEGPYRFNLFDIPGTLAELSRRWQQDRVVLEETFFNTRIPVREEQ